MQSWEDCFGKRRLVLENAIREYMEMNMYDRVCVIYGNQMFVWL